MRRTREPAGVAGEASVAGVAGENSAGAATSAVSLYQSFWRMKMRQRENIFKAESLNI